MRFLKYLKPRNVTRNVASNVVNEDKIRNSKLPDSIKEAMIKNPIPTMEQISLRRVLDMSSLEGAKKLMEREGLTKKQPSQVQLNNLNLYIRQQIHGIKH
jgi:hypothetical protein